MKEDPFLSQIGEGELDYFVNREEIVNSIIYDVGVARRGIPIIDLLVGPAGCGKTTVLRYINTVLGKLKQEYPQEYTFQGELVSTDYLYGEQLSDIVPGFESTQPWLRESIEGRDYLLLDDVKPEHAKNVATTFMKTTLKVLATSVFDYTDVYANLPVTPKAYFLKPMEPKDLTQMLSRRLERVMTKRDHGISILDYFKEDALSAIYTYSFGVPKLALKCASEALRLLRNIYAHDTISTPDGEQKVTRDIAEQACNITKCFQAHKELDNISRIKRDVLNQILKGSKTPTEVSSALRKDRTTMSRHLSDLKDLGLVRLETRGRESVYEATDAVKARIEIELMPGGE
jgi:DNA-binding transcriptional ArsR family regulator